MKKQVVIFSICAVLAIGITTAAFSMEGDTCPMCQGKGMMKMGDMMKMNPMQSQKMMGNRSVTATSDGGVVIMIGNKLFKYDKDLKLTAKTEIKMDAGGMEKGKKMGMQRPKNPKAQTKPDTGM